MRSKVGSFGVLSLLALTFFGCASDRQRFASPDDAMRALTTMAETKDAAAAESLFGASGLEFLSSADQARDEEGRLKLVAAAKEHSECVSRDDGRIDIVYGHDAWPFPIPLAEDSEGWYFDMEAGADELLQRRIGWNETEAISLCREMLDIQRIYFYRDWDEDGVQEFATRMNSTPGTFDGLYWQEDVENGVPYSPLHGFVERNRQYIAEREESDPWRGYEGKILLRQGPAAPSGASEFMKDGHMTGGFAMILWPAAYGDTGVMSFMVSHEGVVYERDLGPDSAAIGGATETFNPDEGWTSVE